MLLAARPMARALAPDAEPLSQRLARNPRRLLALADRTTPMFSARVRRSLSEPSPQRLRNAGAGNRPVRTFCCAAVAATRSLSVRPFAAATFSQSSSS